MLITRGDTVKFNVTVKDSAGVLFDLTGYTMTMTAKTEEHLDDATDGDAIFQATAVISAPATGVGAFTLTPTMTDQVTGTYFYDIQISDGSDNVYTIVKATELEIRADVTRSI